MNCTKDYNDIEGKKSEDARVDSDTNFHTILHNHALLTFTVTFASTLFEPCTDRIVTVSISSAFSFALPGEEDRKPKV